MIEIWSLPLGTHNLVQETEIQITTVKCKENGNSRMITKPQEEEGESP